RKPRAGHADAPRGNPSAARGSKSGDVETSAAFAERDRSIATVSVSFRATWSPATATIACTTAGPGAPLTGNRTSWLRVPYDGSTPIGRVTTSRPSTRTESVPPGEP